MLESIRSLWTHRRLVRGFVVRDLKARYVGSTMGFFWSVVVPIINLFVFMFVFRLVMKVRWGDQATETMTALVMLSGIVVWSAFAETMSRATNCLVENANLIQKVVFPAEVLPVYLTLSSLVNMLIGLPVVMLGLICLSLESQIGLEFAPGRLGLPLLAIPLLVVLQGVFTTGVGFLLATLNAYFRDAFHMIGVFTMVWMFATPIFYPAALLRGKSFEFLLDINPMHWLIQCYRDAIIWKSWPSLGYLVPLVLVSVAAYGLGATFFMANRRRFPDLL